MSVQERKRYNLVIFVVFVIFFFLHGNANTIGLGNFPELPPSLDNSLTFIIVGIQGGWIAAGGMVGGVWLGVKLLKKQSKGAIILACVLFPLTFAVFAMLGMVFAIPFAIYNVVLLRRIKRSGGEPGYGVETQPLTLPEDEVKAEVTEGDTAKKKKSTGTKVVIGRVFVCGIILYFVISLTVGFRTWEPILHGDFYPTMGEAYASFVGGARRYMGEILMVDDHGDNLSVFHEVYFRRTPADRLRAPRPPEPPHMSHFIRKTYNGEVLYARASAGIMTPTIDTYVFPLRTVENSIATSLFGFDHPLPAPFIPSELSRESIGRVPLYGTSVHSYIYNLTINGQHVDYVVEYLISHVQHGEVVRYFWYFSDFQFDDGDEIVISFREAY